MMEEIEYWQKRIKYYQRKYGKTSIEVKAAKLNYERIAKTVSKQKEDKSFREAFPEHANHQAKGWAFPEDIEIE